MVVQEKAWCIGNIDIYAFLDTLTQVMLVTEETESLLLDTILLLEEILWIGGVRNKISYLAQVQK